MTDQIVADCREALRERWQQVRNASPALALTAHQPLRAIQAEEKAEAVLTALVLPNPLDAYLTLPSLDYLWAKVSEVGAIAGAKNTIWHL